jgi:alkylation response protein AidB-like acyl-CoA dehydrogenase
VIADARELPAGPDWPAHVEALLGGVRPLANRELAPHAARWDEQARVDQGLLARLGDELGLFGLSLAEQDGGSAAGMLGAVAVIDELAAHSGSLAAMVAVHEGAGLGLAALVGDPERRAAALELWLHARAPGCWVGEHHGIQCVREGESWRLRGRAPMLPGAAGGGPIALVATAPAGPTVFVLAEDALVQRRPRGALGLRATQWGELSFDLRVDDSTRMSADGGGAELAATAHARVSVLLAAVASGLARAALTQAAAYARERRQFGQAIAEFQAIQWKLADGATGRDAGFGLAIDAAAQLDRGVPGAAAAAARAHLLAVRHAVVACSDALQIHGGYGYTREYPIERMLRDARACAIVDRPEPVLRTVVSTAIAERFA